MLSIYYALGRIVSAGYGGPVNQGIRDRLYFVFPFIIADQILPGVSSKVRQVFIVIYFCHEFSSSCKPEIVLKSRMIGTL